MHTFIKNNGFIKWIEILYRSPPASVVTNGMHSPPFDLKRGTRQGCCLSPLLFALALEPLAISVRENASIKGIKIGQITHVIALYADNILLFLVRAGKIYPGFNRFEKRIQLFFWLQDQL